MTRILSLSAGFAFAAVAAAQGTPSIQWRVTDDYGISSCRMVFDLARHRFVAQGARGALQTDLTVEWDGSRWETRRTSNAPSVRVGFGLAYDLNRTRVVLFGGSLDGSNTTAQLPNDVWEYDGLDWEARNPAVRPPGRQQLAMAYDIIAGRVLMTGGSTETSPAMTETCTWDGTAWQQLAATSPRLVRPEMAPHLTTQRMVLVGARAGGSGETWTFDGTNWTQAAGAGLPTAPSYRMTTDIANDRVVLLVGDQAT